MLKIVDTVTFTLLKTCNRFDSKYYYLGEILDKTLNCFNTEPLVSYTSFIRKGIFDLNSRYYCKIGIPFLRISNLMSYTINEKGLVYIPPEIHKQEKNTILKPGDIALSKVGKYLGKISQVPLRYDEVNISQNIIGVGFDCEKYLKNYIFLYLTTPLAINQILRVSKAHNQNKLTLPDIRQLKIPLLSDEKMQYYSREVDKLAELDNTSFALIKKAQSLFIEYLDVKLNEIQKENFFETRLLDIKDESFFTANFSSPQINNSIRAIESVEYKALNEIVMPYKGHEVGSENYNLYVDKSESDIPFIRTSDIVNYSVDNYPDFYISEDIYKTLTPLAKEGDIIFSKDGSIGHLAIITGADKVIIASGFSILRVNQECEISPYYIFCALSIPEIGELQAKKRTVIASTIPHLRLENLLKIEIPILKKGQRLEIDQLIKEAFELKNIRKIKLDKIKTELEKEFEL